MTGVLRSVPMIGLVSILFAVQAGYSQKRPCADAQGRRALDEAGALRSWDALYGSYRLYRQCDDGAIGEGYSESVARILVDHWNTLPHLAHLAEKDPGLRRFVMEHVDGTLNMDDAEKIRRNAKGQCPAGLRTFCNDLAKQADAALKEASSP
jgi:hypothetical protein